MACSLKKKRFENKETLHCCLGLYSLFFNHSSEIICSRSQGAFLCHELFFDKDFNFMIMMSSAY